jgi:8-oxo-dGTP pyrophosphatase MutT (NUDIX family)
MRRPQAKPHQGLTFNTPPSRGARVRTVAPPESEIEELRRRHGRFHERRFEFSWPGSNDKPFPAEKSKGVRAWVILVPVDIYRQTMLVRKVGKEDWFFPGGGVEAGESVDEAAVRELEEEVGLVPEGGGLKALWWWTVQYADGPATMAHFVYLMTVVGEAEIHDKKEIAEVRTFKRPPKEGLYAGLIHDALGDTGMMHQWDLDFETELKFGTG